MKIRNGFVSNSSSSSFLIDASLLTIDEVDKIWNHIEVAKNIKEHHNGGLSISEFYRWNIKKEGDNNIRLYTMMDNFDMRTFLDLIEINEKSILEYEPGGDGGWYDYGDDE